LTGHSRRVISISPHFFKFNPATAERIKMSLDPHLLDDAAMRQFIAQGYLLVQTDQPLQFHQQLCEQLDKVIDAEGNPGNNILPRLPQIGEVFAGAPMRGALTSLLGPNYSMHPHRYCHLNRPGSEGQAWHKDDYVYDQNARHHRFRWVMAFYYPQAVTPDMGPSGVMPGRQYYNGISDSDPAKATELELKLCGPAGTVALVNFDVWHRATANTSSNKRYMLKFLFLRMEEPQAPSWNNQVEGWQPVEGDALSSLSSDVWQWLRGKGHTAVDGGGELDDRLAALDDGDETRRLDAVYNFSGLGAAGIAPLIEALRRQARGLAEADGANTAANPQGSNPAELSAAYALAALGEIAVEPLVAELEHADWRVRAAAADALGNMARTAKGAAPVLGRSMQDGHMWVRRNAAEALGNMAPDDEDSIARLSAVLADDDERVRRNAALALAKIGPHAAPAVAALAKLLADENRYVRYNVFLALQRIGSPAAREALWADMEVARWCSITTRETQY
jgi:hypothetical protein